MLCPLREGGTHGCAPVPENRGVTVTFYSSVQNFQDSKLGRSENGTEKNEMRGSLEKKNLTQTPNSVEGPRT